MIIVRYYCGKKHSGVDAKTTILNWEFFNDEQHKGYKNNKYAT